MLNTERSRHTLGFEADIAAYPVKRERRMKAIRLRKYFYAQRKSRAMNPALCVSFIGRSLLFTDRSGAAAAAASVAGTASLDTALDLEATRRCLVVILGHAYARLDVGLRLQTAGHRLVVLYVDAASFGVCFDFQLSFSLWIDVKHSAA